MNQTHRLRKGKCMFCDVEVDILQVYNTHLSQYEDVSIPVCRTCMLIKEIEESEKRCTNN